MKVNRSVFLIVTIFFLSVWNLVIAQENEQLKITHGPYLQAMSENSVIIVWFTNKKCVSKVEYGTGENTQNFPTYGSVVQTAKSSEHGLIDAFTTIHRISLTGLKPGTKYRYRVFSKEIVNFKPYEVTYGGSITSGVHKFETFDKNKSAFSFIVVTDIHENAERLEKMLKSISWNGVDLLFSAGDAINYYEDDSQIFNGFLDVSVKYFAREIPLLSVRGNQETRGEYARKLIDIFPTVNNKFYYSFNHGGVHFIVLDSGEDKPDTHPVYAGLADFDSYREEQAAWLMNDIKSDAYRNADFRIVLFHIPPFGRPGAHGRKQVTDLWVPILNKAGIDLLLCGHTHRFSRRDPEKTVNSFPILITGVDTVTKIKVKGRKLHVTVTNLNGTIVDSFDISAEK